MLLIKFQQHVISELALKLHQGKKIPNAKLRSDNQQNCSFQGVTIATSIQYLIPHMIFPEQEVCPFSAQNSLGYSTSLLGLQQ